MVTMLTLRLKYGKLLHLGELFAFFLL